MTLATICGIAIFLVVASLFFVISLVGMIASDTASTKVKDNSVFVIKLWECNQFGGLPGCQRLRGQLSPFMENFFAFFWLCLSK